MKKFVEIRSYNLKPGTRAEFHRVASAESIPMLKRCGVDVVTFGPSPHDSDTYYLIRAYESLADRQASQDAFYGSAEWRDGPRAAMVAPIVSYTSIVIEMEPQVVDALRVSA